MSDTELRPEATLTNDGDHDRFAHIVRKSQLGDALVFGTPIEALCGKKWVPSRSPENYPVCPDCKRELEKILS